jgi:hypothetical protein
MEKVAQNSFLGDARLVACFIALVTKNKHSTVA